MGGWKFEYVAPRVHTLAGAEETISAESSNLKQKL